MDHAAFCPGRTRAVPDKRVARPRRGMRITVTRPKTGSLLGQSEESDRIGGEPFRVLCRRGGERIRQRRKVISRYRVACAGYGTVHLRMAALT